MNPWYVLGAGAMGSLIAYRMGQKNIPCTLLHHHNAPSESLLIDEETETPISVIPLKSLAPASIDRLLVTTKAGQLSEALMLARPYLSLNAIVACTANGMGFEVSACESLPGHSLYRAISTAGAFRDSANRVHAVSRGVTRMGLPGSSVSAPVWFTDSLGQLQGWRWEPEIEQAIAEKFSVNCIINPLTAAYRCRNGELLERDAAKPVVQALCRESEPVLVALGLWSAEGNLLNTVISVCQSTAQNNSSMLQDRMAGRPTEIDFLNGELLRRASALGLELPLNAALVSELS